jgi:5-dehydro-2-deoxygluconokinase
VSEGLQAVLPLCDLIVGTEEEVHIAAGEADTLRALSRIRALSPATLVLKRGPRGCVVFEGAIPARLEDGIVGKGFAIEVYNVLGAGDAFLSGFLRGWLRGEPHETSATWANACGAIVVSRLLCSPEIPTFAELQYFLEHGSPCRALRRDEALNHVHRASTRARQPRELLALAVDPESWFEEEARRLEARGARIAAFKLLAVEAAARVAAKRAGFGMLIDGASGADALAAARRGGLWIGRPVELPGSRPLRFAGGPDVGSELTDWPAGHTVSCLVHYHPDDEPALRIEQHSRLQQVHQAARRRGLELAVGILAGEHGKLKEDTTARVLRELYGLGIKPDWWTLEAQPSAEAWAEIGRSVGEADPWCRGVLLAERAEGAEAVDRALLLAAGSPWVKGFAIGGAIFAKAATGWLHEEITDAEAVSMMEERYSHFIEVWRKARG